VINASPRSARQPFRQPANVTGITVLPAVPRHQWLQPAQLLSNAAAGTRRRLS
jgi:hypothetical protein